jgi:hypothetical protein
VVHASFKLAPYYLRARSFPPRASNFKSKDNVAKGIVLHHMKNCNKRFSVWYFPLKSKSLGDPNKQVVSEHVRVDKLIGKNVFKRLTQTNCGERADAFPAHMWT